MEEYIPPKKEKPIDVNIVVNPNIKYQKHFLYIAEETTYVVEQLEYSDVSRYDYEFIFRPEAIVPIQIKTQVGEN